MNTDEIAKLIKQNEQYKTLIEVFDDDYVCEICQLLGVKMLPSCENPLHFMLIPHGRTNNELR